MGSLFTRVLTATSVHFSARLQPFPRLSRLVALDFRRAPLSSCSHDHDSLIAPASTMHAFQLTTPLFFDRRPPIIPNGSAHGVSSPEEGQSLNSAPRCHSLRLHNRFPRPPSSTSSTARLAVDTAQHHLS